MHCVKKSTSISIRYMKRVGVSFGKVQTINHQTPFHIPTSEFVFGNA